MFDRGRRRFITLLGGAAVAWPLGPRTALASEASGQRGDSGDSKGRVLASEAGGQRGDSKAQRPVPVIGFLNTTSLQRFAALAGEFREGVSSQHLLEGRDFRMDYRWAEGDYTRLPALANELVQRKVALIAATGGMVSAQAAIKVTTTIPILFVTGIDPAQAGLVASLNRPNGNATGVSLYTTELVSKRLELLKAVVHGSTFALLVNPDTDAVDEEIRDTSASARALDVELIVVQAHAQRDLDAAFGSAVRQRASAIMISPDALFTSLSDQLVALAARHSLPAIYPFRRYVSAGGLMSYGAELTWAYHQIGVYAGRILKGDKPAMLPVQLPTRFDLVINAATAKALGLEIPATLLGRADEMIE